MSKLLLKGGQILNPLTKTCSKQDILIDNDKIIEIARNIKIDQDENVMDVTGKIISPGLIDMHVHLREPGFEHKETIKTGTRAAAKGGFTSVACMPNTNPVIDNSSLVESILYKVEKGATVNVFPIGAITKGSKGEELAEIGSMKETGIIAISDDGHSVMNAETMRLALIYANNFDLPIISHCEDKNLAGEGVVHQGFYSTTTGLDPIPASAENVIVARDICLAEETNSRLHIAHISTKGAVEIVRNAKRRGVKVTCEVTPHHFTLTDELITSFDTNTKVNPPLRSAEDVEAVKKGLKDGTIDVIATDHAPHAREEKDVEYDQAPFGISGIETALGLVITELVEPGILSLEEAINKMTVQPAEILQIDKGKIDINDIADLTIIDPDKSWTVDPKKFVSKGKNTPFKNRKLKGKVVATIVGGNIVYQEKTNF